MSASQWDPAETILVIAAGKAAAVEALPRVTREEAVWSVELSDSWVSPWRTDTAYQHALSCLNQAGSPREESDSWPWIARDALRAWLDRLRGEVEKAGLLPAVYADAGTFGDTSEQARKLKAYRYVRVVAEHRVRDAWSPEFTVPAPPADEVLEEYLPRPTAAETDPGRRSLSGQELVRSREAARVSLALKQADLHLGSDQRIVVVVGPDGWPKQERNLFAETLLTRGSAAYRRALYGSVESVEGYISLEYVGILYEDLRTAMFGASNQRRRVRVLHRLASRLSRFSAPKKPAAAEALRDEMARTGADWSVLLQSYLRSAIVAGLADLSDPKPSKLGEHDWITIPSGERWKGRPSVLMGIDTALDLKYLARQVIAKARAAVERELWAQAAGPTDREASDAMDRAEEHDPLAEESALPAASSPYKAPLDTRKPLSVAKFEARDLLCTYISRAELTPSEEAVVRLHVVKDKPYEEIADETGRSYDSVKQLMYKARKKLRRVREQIA